MPCSMLMQMHATSRAAAELVLVVLVVAHANYRPLRCGPVLVLGNRLVTAACVPARVGVALHAEAHLAIDRRPPASRTD
jgi:hypothetical protein